MNIKTLRNLAAAMALAFTSTAFAGVEVIDPYVRAVPPGAPATAAFMGLKADADGVALIEADSDVAKAVELHTHVHDNGVMRMRPIEKIELKKGEVVTLQPGGLHVMLIGLTRPVKPGDSVDIELKFSDGTSQKITAPVRRIKMKGMMKGMGMGGHKPMSMPAHQ